MLTDEQTLYLENIRKTLLAIDLDVLRNLSTSITSMISNF